LLKPLSEARRSELKEAVGHAEQSLRGAADWLTGRGVEPSTARRFHLGVVDSDHPHPEFRRYAGRLVIPGIGPGGVYSVRFRDLTGGSPQKMLGLPNTPVRPFNTRALHYAGDHIAICEGELDAIIMEQCGIPAVGFTGVSSWQRWSHRLFEGFPTVYIMADHDQPGLQFAEKVQKAVPQGRIVVCGDEGEDVNDVFLAHGRAGVYDVVGLVDPSIEEEAA